MTDDNRQPAIKQFLGGVEGTVQVALRPMRDMVDAVGTSSRKLMRVGPGSGAPAAAVDAPVGSQAEQPARSEPALEASSPECSPTLEVMSPTSRVASVEAAGPHLRRRTWYSKRLILGASSDQVCKVEQQQLAEGLQNVEGLKPHHGILTDGTKHISYSYPKRLKLKPEWMPFIGQNGQDGQPDPWSFIKTAGEGNKYQPPQYTVVRPTDQSAIRSYDLGEKSASEKGAEEKVEVSFASFCGAIKAYDLGAGSRPLNPAGPTGLAGRGALHHWGPNQCVDMIISRKSDDGVEILMLMRKDAKLWGLPGVTLLNKAEKEESACKRALKKVLESDEQLGLMWKNMGVEKPTAGTEIFSEMLATELLKRHEFGLDRFALTLGSRWKKVGHEKPVAEHEVICPKLGAALQTKQEFSTAEVANFELKDLKVDSFIKVENTYFQQAALTEFSTAEVANFELKDLKVDSFIKVENEYFGLAEEQIDDIFFNSKVVFRNFLDEARNTDNSWLETTVRHYECPRNKVIRVKAQGFDADFEAMWVNFSSMKEDGLREVLPSHRLCVANVIHNQLNGSYLEHTMYNFKLGNLFVQPYFASSEDCTFVRVPKANSLVHGWASIQESLLQGSKHYETCLEIRVHQMRATDDPDGTAHQTSPLVDRLCRVQEDLVKTGLVNVDEVCKEHKFTSRLSPVAPINLPPGTRARSGIPAHATSFAFIYPGSKGEPSVFPRGGFVYFHKQTEARSWTQKPVNYEPTFVIDSTSAICSHLGQKNTWFSYYHQSALLGLDARTSGVSPSLANPKVIGLIPAIAVEFEGPNKITLGPKDKNRRKAARTIQELLWHPVTVLALLEKGAQFYAWVPPNYTLGDYPNVNGGFAYATTMIKDEFIEELLSNPDAEVPADFSAVYFVLTGFRQREPLSMNGMQDLLNQVLPMRSRYEVFVDAVEMGEQLVIDAISPHFEWLPRDGALLSKLKLKSKLDIPLRAGWDDETGYTAMMIAAIRGHHEIVTSLLRNGASATRKQKMKPSGLKWKKLTPDEAADQRKTRRLMKMSPLFKQRVLEQQRIYHTLIKSRWAKGFASLTRHIRYEDVVSFTTKEWQEIVKESKEEKEALGDLRAEHCVEISAVVEATAKQEVADEGKSLSELYRPVLDLGKTAMDLAMDGWKNDTTRKNVTTDLSIRQMKAAIALLPGLFGEGAGSTVQYAVQITARAAREILHVGGGRGRWSQHQDELMKIIRDAQDHAVRLLGTLQDHQALTLVETEQGLKMIKDAVKHDCRDLLSEKKVLEALQQNWRGRLYSSLVRGHVIQPNGTTVYITGYSLWLLYFFVLLPLNMLFVPFEALSPTLGCFVKARLGSWGKKRPHDPEAYWKSLGLYPKSMYLLAVPAFRFYLNLLLTLVLIVLLTRMHVPEDGDAGLEVFGVTFTATKLFLWMMAYLCHTSRMAFSDGRHFFFADTLNLIEALAGIFTTIGLLWDVVGFFADNEDTLASPAAPADAPTHVHELTPAGMVSGRLLRSTHSGSGNSAGLSNLTQDNDEDPYIWFAPSPTSLVVIGVGMLVVSAGFRLLTVNETTGPLVILMMRMVPIVLQWLTISLVVTTAFATMFYILSFDMEVGDMPVVCSKPHLMSHEFLLSIMKFFQFSVDAGLANTHCLMYGEHRVLAPALMVLYLVTSVIVLVNMLIAMLTKEFDEDFQQRERNYAFYFTIAVVNNRHSSTTAFSSVWPAPLTWLQLPPWISAMVLQSGVKHWQCVASVAKASSRMRRWMQDHPWIKGAFSCVDTAYHRLQPSQEQSMEHADQMQSKDDLSPAKDDIVIENGKLWSEQYSIVELLKVSTHIKQDDGTESLLRQLSTQNEELKNEMLELPKRINPELMRFLFLKLGRQQSAATKQLNEMQGKLQEKLEKELNHLQEKVQEQLQEQSQALKDVKEMVQVMQGRAAQNQ